jgi:hypothetical protein
LQALCIKGQNVFEKENLIFYRSAYLWVVRVVALSNAGPASRATCSSASPTNASALSPVGSTALTKNDRWGYKSKSDGEWGVLHVEIFNFSNELVMRAERRKANSSFI